ncbi:MAG: ATP-binding protein [Myxococcales bacterium]
MAATARVEPTAKWVEDLNDIVRCAAELTRAYVVERAGSLEIDTLLERLPARVSRIDVEQVLVNVIRNAAESRVGRAQVVVSTRRHGDSETSTEVSADGTGIAEKDRDRVFDPFFTTRLDLGARAPGCRWCR